MSASDKGVSIFHMTLAELRAERERIIAELCDTDSENWNMLYRRGKYVDKLVEKGEAKVWPAT